MSLYLDQKYLSLISNRLPLFKKKGDRLYNCRCILCGDSVKHRSKARGYFFSYKNELRYKCHNCSASLTFRNFLMQLDKMLYSQYALESYSENGKVSSNTTIMTFEEPKFDNKRSLLDSILDRLDTLPEDNEAVQFCLKRKIPKHQFNKLYFIDDIKNIVQLNDTYKASIKGSEPRLVIPFYNEDGQLAGVTCRALRGEALRYITVKVKEDDTLIFGLKDLDKTKLVYVVEGPIDSLFLDNCLAAGSTALSKVLSLGIPKENLIYIFDNQPRNKEVCSIIEKSINKEYNVVIWPQTLIEKDINDMILSDKNVARIVKENTYSGLAAKAKFMAWKRC